MKLSDSNKSIILVVLGIVVLVLAIIYFAKPNYEAKQALDAENLELETRLADLQEKESHRAEYEAGIVEYDAKFQEVLSAFPADLNQEISIMFLQGIKDSNDFSIESLGLGPKSEFYTLGTNGADANIGDGTEAPATEEAAPAEESSEAVAEVEEGAAESDELVCYSAAFPIKYYGGYKSLKDVISYIDSYSDRMTVDSLTISFDNSKDIYSGDIDLTCYSIEGESRPERSIDLNNVETGVSNIFEGGNGAGQAVDATLNKYDENDGAAIETSYDFYTMLNAASSDVSAKVVGQNGADKQKTVISNSDNAISVINYEFYEKDGKNYCKYTLDNTQSYEAEITSADDVKVLIQSSERKNDEDLVKAKITISNSTSLPVYVKVTGDDSVSPRVSITKTGTVKIYQ
ncbi:MAG: hypothetical protein K6G76_08870 [Lachnospiraceae bacterium]|nr:hypothetical protein [Lachnospiraceae bacterium]